VQSWHKELYTFPHTFDPNPNPTLVHYKDYHFDRNNEWCDDSITFFVALRERRNLGLFKMPNPLIQQPGDLTLVSANTWHAGQINTPESTTIFGYVDRVKGISSADSKNEVGPILSLNDSQDEYSVGIKWVNNEETFHSNMRQMWPQR